MRIFITLFLLLISFNNLNAQKDEHVINDILFDLFDFQQDTILIESIKKKTYFGYDSISFENTTGLTVPSTIILEWNNNEENKDFEDKWDEQGLNKTDTIFYGNDTIIEKKPFFKCLTKDKVDQIFSKTQKRQKIYSVSKILFDNSKENGIFHFTIVPLPGDFFSKTILIKKVFGKWIIITEFDFIMT